LARLPWPSALIPEFIPIARVIGPLTIRIGPPEQVVQRRPCSVAIGSSAASSAANKIGMYSGLQPAITALMATFSTVHGARLGGTRPTTSSGLRLVPPSIRMAFGSSPARMVSGWRLYSRPGNDFTRRFPLIVEALVRLRSRSCIIDGEAVACDDNGVASFDLICRHRHNDRAFLYAFDLIELTKAGLGLRFNEHLEGDGPTVFSHACKMGLEGVVSKRKDSLYRSGRSPDWLKMKNSDAPAVRREAEEDWGR